VNHNLKLDVFTIILKYFLFANYQSDNRRHLVNLLYNVRLDCHKVFRISSFFVLWKKKVM